MLSHCDLNIHLKQVTNICMCLYTENIQLKILFYHRLFSYNFSFTQIDTYTVFVTPMDIKYNYCHYPEFAMARFHINSIQKKFENMYLIIDSSVLNQFSAFNCRLNEEKKNRIF